MMLLIYVCISTVWLFLWYVVAMYFVRRRHRIRERSVVLYYLLLPLVASGLIFDVIYNLFPGSLIFLQFPRYFRKPRHDLTLSMRLERYRDTVPGWRNKLASFICEKILNPFDPDGHHC